MSERNIAIKDALGLLVGDDASPFAAPIASQDDLLSRGLIDETGTATSKGVLFTQLQDAGMFDERGALTDRGKAYAMDYRDVLEDPETMWAYQIRKGDGVDAPQGDQGIVGPFVKELSDAAGGAVTALKNTAKDFAKDVFGFGSGANPDEARAATAAMVEGAIKSNQEFAGLLGVGLAHLIDPIVQLAGEEKDAQVWQARRERDLVNYKNQQAKDGEALEDLQLSDTVVAEMANAKKALGDERYTEIVTEGGALGRQGADPVNALAVLGGAVGGLKGAGIVTRAALEAEKLAGKAAVMDAKIASAALAKAAAEQAAQTAQTTSAAARNAAARLTERALATGDNAFAEASKKASDIAAKHESQIPKWTTAVDEATSKLDELNAQRAAIPEFAKSRLAKMTEAGRALGPVVEGAGNLTESTGDLLSRINKGLANFKTASGVDTALGAVRAAASLAGFGAGGIPGALTAEAVLRSGPAVSGVGKILRNVGKEMMKARGQVPFWQRVANYSDMGPAHRLLAHTMDTATLGGALPGAAKRAALGTMGAYPSDLLFEYLADDSAPASETFKRALGKSLVLGGSSAALGGMFLGSKERHKQLALGDQRNFMEGLRRDGDANQMARFNAIPQGVQRSIATYAAANPNLKWKFKVEGDSRFDGPTNTVEINIAGDTPLRALVAHEINHNLLVRNNMEDGAINTLVGTGEAGGILRAKDGTLDPDFQKFMDAYNNRLALQGESPIGIREAAKEYFVETAADMMGEAAESGRLGQMAGKTNLRRMVESIIPKVPILKDLHMKMGGLMEPDTGRMVVGNGLVAEGLRERPEVKRMVREMMSKSAGRAQGSFTPAGKRSQNKEGGTNLEVRNGDKGMEDIQAVSLYQMDDNENFLTDKAGNRLPVTRAMDMQRANIGLEARRIHDKMVDAGYKFKPGEIRWDADAKKWTEGFFSDQMLKELAKSGIYNATQMRHVRMVSNAIKNKLGTRFATIQQPAIKTINGKKRYDGRPMTLTETSPYAMTITSNNNIITRNVDVKKLAQNIEKLAGSKTGKRLFGGDTELIKKRVGDVMEIQSKGGLTDDYFLKEHGPVEAKNAKNFINSVMGTISKSEQPGYNPSLELGSSDATIRSQRMDRTNQMTEIQGESMMPFLHRAWVENRFPSGVPKVDASGNPAVTRAKPMPQLSLPEISQRWSDSGVKNNIHESRGVITLSRVEVPKAKQGGGIGTEFMRELTSYADSTGQTVALTPSKDFGATSVQRLKEFYKRFGFVENKGKNKDFAISESMIRQPTQ